MPRKRDEEKPLPHGWDIGRDFDGKIYYINHNDKKTTWVDPRDSVSRPVDFSECIADEFPVGWERMYDYQRGVYYVDHINQTTQDTDPRVEWRALQEDMLKQYLATAETDLRAKEELVEIKEQRLHLAQDEYLHLSQHLNTTLSNLSTSTTSLNSTGSTVSTKYDPDLLRADVIHARSRVQRLKRELATIDSEMTYKQKGVETLARVNEKFINNPEMGNGQCFTLEEAQAIRMELYNIQQSLTTGEQEKVELMRSLACLKDDLTRLQHSESSLDINNPLDRLSTASQTDLSGELVPVGARLAEMARLRLRYDDARRQVQDIQQRLAALEEKMSPGQLESDKDRLLLIQEKEQLVRELRSITPRSRSTQEMIEIKNEIQKLEGDLNNAMEVSNRCIADRLRIHEEKQMLLQQLMDSMRTVSQLESQLKLLSASTLSMSSSSSLGSLSSSHASSKGSLSSLSFTDIYGLSSTTPADPTMLDLHRRVVANQTQKLESPSSSSVSVITGEDSLLTPSSSSSSTTTATTNTATILLNPSTMTNPNQSMGLSSPHSSLSSVSPPVSPQDAFEQQQQKQLSKQQQKIQHLDKQLADLQLASVEMRKLSTITESTIHQPRIIENVTTTPISESTTMTTTSDDSSKTQSLHPVAVRKTSSSVGGGTFVSAAVSDESVAGDSGVFEAATTTIRTESDGGLPSMNLETAQVQIKLRYAIPDSLLHVGIERARNLSALFIPENRKICIKAALLPCSTPAPITSFCTRALTDLSKPTFGENFPISVPMRKLVSKTLQVTIWAVSSSNPAEGSYREDCLGSAQVSLADFDPKTACTRWYNILSFHFMQQPAVSNEVRPKISVNVAAAAAVVATSGSGSNTAASSKQGTLKEESSDDSTIISSQTSTLTRNIEPEAMMNHQETLPSYFQESEDEEEEEKDEEIEIPIPSDYLRRLTKTDKETNTECIFVQPSAASNKRSGQQQQQQQQQQLRLPSHEALVKRSQTFTPSAPINKNDYICRLNRSDSDSAMPLYKRLSFQRTMLERRSLRVPMTTSRVSLPSTKKTKKKKTPSKSKLFQTPLDLELDLAAQQTKLQLLQDEIDRLKAIKNHMEEAKKRGEKELPAWLQEQEQFQQMLSQVETKSLEDKRLDKMLRKTGKDIYKLRKTRTSKGQPDVHSFKEKMAFFTSLRANIPVIPNLASVEDDDAVSSAAATSSSSAATATAAAAATATAASDTEDTASECSTLKNSDTLRNSSSVSQNPPPSNIKLSSTARHRLTTTTTMDSSNNDSSETVNTITEEDSSTPSSSSSSEKNEKKNKKSKFTYEIDPVIGVIV